MNITERSAVFHLGFREFRFRLNLLQISWNESINAKHIFNGESVTEENGHINFYLEANIMYTTRTLYRFSLHSFLFFYKLREINTLRIQVGNNEEKDGRRKLLRTCYLRLQSKHKITTKYESLRQATTTSKGILANQGILAISE